MSESKTPNVSSLSNGAKTTISFLLFVHLFALGVAILSNTSQKPPPNMLAPPDLKLRLRQVPGVVPYLQVLNMDYGYAGGDRYQASDYQLTHDMPSDLAWRIELSLKLPDGSETQVTIPNDSLQPRLRRLRFQKLAVRAARLEGDDGPDAQIPLAVATHYVRRFGATGGRLRCTTEIERSMMELNDFNPASGRPLPPLETQTPLDFYVLVQNNAVSLLKAESGRDAAAPSTDAAAPAATPGTPPVGSK